MENLTDTEIEILEACQSDDDWSDATDAIKAARDGQYPDDWWDRVKLTGMMDRILSRWGQTSAITITHHNGRPR